MLNYQKEIQSNSKLEQKLELVSTSNQYKPQCLVRLNYRDNGKSCMCKGVSVVGKHPQSISKANEKKIHNEEHSQYQNHLSPIHS